MPHPHPLWSPKLIHRDLLSLFPSWLASLSYGSTETDFLKNFLPFSYYKRGLREPLVLRREGVEDHHGTTHFNHASSLRHSDMNFLCTSALSPAPRVRTTQVFVCLRTVRWPFLCIPKEEAQYPGSSELLPFLHYLSLGVSNWFLTESPTRDRSWLVFVSGCKKSRLLKGKKENTYM